MKALAEQRLGPGWIALLERQPPLMPQDEGDTALIPDLPVERQGIGVVPLGLRQVPKPLRGVAVVRQRVRHALPVTEVPQQVEGFGLERGGPLEIPFPHGQRAKVIEDRAQIPLIAKLPEEVQAFAEVRGGRVVRALLDRRLAEIRQAASDSRRDRRSPGRSPAPPRRDGSPGLARRARWRPTRDSGASALARDDRPAPARPSVPPGAARWRW